MSKGRRPARRQCEASALVSAARAANGSHLAVELARTRPQTKVLYLSGYADESIVRHGVLEPGVAFLQKPFTSDSLARKVRELLERQL